MTLQDFKDQVAREEATIPGTKLRDWTDWKGFKDKMHTLGYSYEQWSDRAAELHAKAREEAAFNAGWESACDLPYWADYSKEQKNCREDYLKSITKEK